jgi:hypothetical protein
MAIDDEANPNNGSGPTVTLVDAVIDPYHQRQGKLRSRSIRGQEKLENRVISNDFVLIMRIAILHLFFL